MKTLLKIILLLLLTTPLYSQKEYNQWVVGFEYFIDFNTPDGEPIFSNDHTLVPRPYKRINKSRVVFYGYPYFFTRLIEVQMR